MSDSDDQKQGSYENDPSLPGNCAACGARMSYLIEPRPKMQKKAGLLFLLGGTLSVAWALVMIAIGLAAEISERLRPRILGFPVIIIAILAPGLAVGALAMRIPRVMEATCGECGNWHRVLIRSKSRKT